MTRHEPHEQTPPPPVSLFPALTLLFASSLTIMAGAIIAPALPGLRTHFLGTPQVEILARLLLTAPALAVALFAPWAGSLVDRLGRRPVLIGGLIAYAAAGTTGLYLPSLLTILFGRLGLGLAVAATMTATTTMIADLYQGPVRARFLSWQAAFMAFGGVFFLAGGGAVSDLHWRAPFGVYLVALVVLVATLRYLPEPLRESDVPRGTTTAQAAPWGTISALYGLSFSAMLLMFLLPVQLPFLLVQRLRAKGLAIGLAIGSSTFWSGLSSLRTPAVVRRLGRRATLALTFAPMVPAYLLIARAESWLAIVFALFLVGAGLGQLMPNVTMWISELAPLALRGRILGGLTTSIFLGQFLSPLVTQPLLAGGRYDRAFYVAAGLAGLLTVLAPLTGRAARHPAPRG